MSEIPEEQWNKRPLWCPWGDCEYMKDVQGKACVGKLPIPQPHDGDFNTHRFCLDTVETHGEIFDLQINHTDAYLFTLLLKDI